ncbi:hypothetical protein Tco_0759784 [Tanacetum coccineum]
MQSWGRSSYARVMVELRADVELKDNIVVAMPKITREGHYTCNVRVEYEWKPPRCSSCKVFGHVHEECTKNTCAGEKKTVKKPSQTSRGVPVGPKMGFKPQKEYRPVTKKPNASSSGNKKKGVEPTIEFANNTPIGAQIDKIERQIGEGKFRLLDNNGNPLVPTSIMESDSEVEMVFDETANLTISNGDFWGTLDEGTEGALGPERPRIYSDLSPEDKEDIWDNVKMLLEGSDLTKEDRESQLLTVRMQLNSKFVNNMLPEWGRFVTAVKLNRGLRDSNYDQLYAYLKQHEAHANENKMMLDRFTQHTVDPLALMSNVSHQQYYSQSSTTPPSIYVPPHLADNTYLDSGLSSMDNLIENLTNTLALLTQSYKTYLPQTNNQLRTSSNTRNQATVQDGRVVVQNVQGRQNRGQGNNARGGGAAGYGGAHNRVGNANPSQARQIKCYNYNGIGYIKRNCTQPKRPQNSEYFKYKMLLMQAQENRVALDEEQLLFIAGGQDNAIDEDVDEQPVQDLALNVDNVFQADDYDAFDSDIDKAPTEQTMFMDNLSYADPVYDEADPSYDSDILFEVHDHDHYQDAVCEHHEEHEMHDDVWYGYIKKKTKTKQKTDKKQAREWNEHGKLKPKACPSFTD